MFYGFEKGTIIYISQTSKKFLQLKHTKQTLRFIETTHPFHDIWGNSRDGFSEIIIQCMTLHEYETIAFETICKCFRLTSIKSRFKYKWKYMKYLNIVVEFFALKNAHCESRVRISLPNGEYKKRHFLLEVTWRSFTFLNGNVWAASSDKGFFMLYARAM